MSSPPTTLGQYQIIREIARSNDIVYEAYDPLMNRRVAVKELMMPGGATAQQQEERINRFRREAQAAGTLNHPNIMTVYSFAEDQGRTFMAMEFLDGHTLRNEIDTKGIIKQERAVEIAREVLEGLAHAHLKGVIHRDIKPDNIQILSNETIKITDFGIARLTFQPNLTMDGQVFGTPSYMSPEQVVGRDIDARSDIFSVGIVLYEMLAGQKPFPGDSVVSISYAIMNREPVQPPGMPIKLWEVVSRAMEKAPAARYQSAGEMLQALDTAMAMPTTAIPATPPPAPYQTANPGAAVGVPPPQAPAYGSPYNSTPYTPYGGAQAYGGPATAGQPITTPYNPYGTPVQTTSHAGHQYPSIYAYGQATPPVVPLPIYTPPPRLPLFKPETTEFLKRLLLTVVIVGTLLTLITVGIVAVAGWVKTYSASQQDERFVGTITSNQDPRIPLNERIETLETSLAQLNSPSKQNEVKAQLAVLYGERGRDYVNQGEFTRAETAFQRGIELNQFNSDLYSGLAELYEQQADSNMYTADERLSLWHSAAENWRDAANQESDRDARNRYRQHAAQTYYQYAYEIAGSSDIASRQEARQALYNAQDMDPGPELRGQIDSLLASLR